VSEVGVEGDPRAALRRRDRGKDEPWIRAFLHAAPMGFLATVGEEGQPFLNSNLFVFDEERHCLYLHTHRTGRTRDNVAGHDRVTFSAAAMGRLLPAAEALEFSVEYAAVVVFGRGTIVEAADEARHGLRVLLEKYAPHLRYGEDYRATTDEELKRTAVYRIDIEAWSGKQKEVPEDFPGAFDFPTPPVPFPERLPGR
jgi:nitroimidazol reductase NimA-like FMN-containing flavoprotein (pyridoxamine 5'-phosphate oxidase superfamily)